MVEVIRINKTLYCVIHNDPAKLYFVTPFQCLKLAFAEEKKNSKQIRKYASTIKRGDVSSVNEVYASLKPDMILVNSDAYSIMSLQDTL